MSTLNDFPATPRANSSLRDAHRGSMANSVSQSYNRFCDNLSASVWAEPNGRRLSFDIHGKPGIAIEIPVH